MIYFNDLDSSCRIKNRKGVREWISSVISSNGKKLGNIGVIIGDDGVLIIDNQFAPLTNKIEAAITDLTKLPVTFVV